MRRTVFLPFLAGIDCLRDESFSVRMKFSQRNVIYTNADYEVNAMRQLLSLLLMMLMLTAPALADDVYTMSEIMTAGLVETDCTYLVICTQLSEPSQVIVNVQDEWGTLYYLRDYGICSGQFQSDEIHLPLEDVPVEYTISLQTNTAIFTAVVRRHLPLITDTAVYARGLSLQELNGGSSRKFAVMLDMAQLHQAPLSAPMVGSDTLLGFVHFHAANGILSVLPEITADGYLDRAKIFVATDAIAARTLGTSRFSGVKATLGEAVDVGNSPYVAVMIQLTISYDEESTVPYTDEPDENQPLLWEQMQLSTPNVPNG